LKSITTFENELEKDGVYQLIASEESFKNLDSTIKDTNLTEAIEKKIKDDTLLGNIYNDLSITNFSAGNYQKTLDFGEKSLFHRKRTTDSLLTLLKVSKK
jgi:hypothetical protein